jgi:hypothetical protein
MHPYEMGLSAAPMGRRADGVNAMASLGFMMTMMMMMMDWVKPRLQTAAHFAVFLLS